MAAWLGRIDPVIPPQEEIIPPSPSVIRELSFEDEQEAAVASLGWSPLAAAAHFYPDSASPTTPGGALAAKTRVHAAADSGNNQNGVVSAPPSPRSSGFVSITTLKRDTIPLPPSGRVIERPLLLSRDATIIEEARRVQDLWSSTPPSIAPLDLEEVPTRLFHGAGEEPDSLPSSSSTLPKPAKAEKNLFSAAVMTPAPALRHVCTCL